MIYLRLLLIILVVGVPSVYGQDWAQNDPGGLSYNCAAVRALIDAHGDLNYVRTDDAIFTVKDYHALMVPVCLAASEPASVIEASEVGEQSNTTMVDAANSGTMFQITVDEVINLRACANTACDLLGRARSGDLLDVVGADGDWYEIAHESGRVYIAAWLTRKVVDPPRGLLADFQFAALNPNQYFSDILHGTTGRSGTHWLNLTQADGSPAAFELQAMNWGADATANANSQPRFFGWGKHDWTALPHLLPDSSFYVYVVRHREMFELPIANYWYVDSYNLGFDQFERPSGVVAGAQVRILVAESGQADQVQNWIEAGNPPATVAPQAGTAVFSYEAGYREVSSGAALVWAPNISGEGEFSIEFLRDGAEYEVTLVAIGRGGRSRQSRFAAIELPSRIASG